MVRIGVAFLVGVLFLLGAAQASAVTNTFQGPGTDWNTDANWSQGHIPLSSEDVVINSGSVSLATGVNGAANSISLNTGAPASGSLTLNNTHTLTVGAGTSTLNGGVTVFGTSTLTLGGATTWSSGGLSAQNSTININAAFSIAGDLNTSNFGGNTINISATGSLSKTSGSGLSQIEFAIDNDGAINANSGTLRLTGGDAATPAGTIAIATGATLELQAAATRRHRCRARAPQRCCSRVQP